MKPRGVPAQLAHRLRTAQHQCPHHGQLRRAQVHHLRHHVFVFGHPATAAMKNVTKTLLTQSLQSVGDSVFVICGYRIAVVLLITGNGQRVEGQGIVLRRSELLLNQGAEHSNLYIV